MMQAGREGQPERGANPAPAPRSPARVVKAAGYQSASITLGASGFQERKEVWGHPAPLPPFSSKQPGCADNGAVPPAAREFGAAGRARRPKRNISPHFLSHKSRPWCWGSSSRCQCRPALVWDAEQHHASAMPQFRPSSTPVTLTGGNWESLGWVCSWAVPGGVWEGVQGRVSHWAAPAQGG